MQQGIGNLRGMCAMCSSDDLCYTLINTLLYFDDAICVELRLSEATVATMTKQMFRDVQHIIMSWWSEGNDTSN